MSSTESPTRPRRKATFKGNYGDLDGDNGKSEIVDSGSDTSEVEKEIPVTPKKRRAPVKRTNTDLDRSARKRATRVLLEKQFGEQDEADEADARLAERIISEDAITSSPTKGIGAMSPMRKLLASANTHFEDEGSQSLFLDGPEGYYDQHKVREKISTTPFSKAPTLEYHEYTKWVHESKSLHSDARQFLKSMYRRVFAQWYFELTQGFGLVFYGVGSKRDLLTEFIEEQIPEHLPVLVVNGYNPATTFKEILVTAVNILVKNDEIRASFPRHPPDMLSALLNYLETQPSDAALVLLIHNIDGESLRSDRSQAILSRLASAQQIWIVASTDHIQSPIMWDAAKIAQYNFIWHDLTTFELYTTETSFEDPLALGKNRSAVASKGVKYVLSSVTSNARSLYKLLICHQIEKMTDLLAANDVTTVATTTYGIEFKLFYRRCVEEMIVSNELNFRTMLSEFIEHKMAVNTRNISGVETVYVPFTRDACEGILEELMEM